MQRTTELSPAREKLANIIDQRTQGIEDCSTSIPNLSFFRREAPTSPAPCFVEPSVLLVAQGTKHMIIGGETYPYDADHFLITSLDIPVISRTVAASQDRPCLGLALKLDFRIMAELIGQSGLPPQKDGPGSKSIGIGSVTPSLMEGFKHLLELLDEPDSIAALAPLFQREIHYRLLTSDQAAHLWEIASAGSQSHRIAKAVDWLKMNFSQPFRVDDLAARVQMSSSAFRHHFRQLTAMSPLQYQKWLRLNEARRLMLNENRDAGEAAFQVGYESPSQFSREYSRLFGAPPKRDIDDLRHKADRTLGPIAADVAPAD